MDPKKKKIYIIAIVVCLVLSAGILIWSKFSGSDGGLAPEANIEIPVKEATGDASVGFGAPSVFPITGAFHTDVVTSPEYQRLQPYTPLDITGQLGRPDPFNGY